jgi:hypothetical protein
LKVTSRHTCVLAAVGLLGSSGCIPDLPPNKTAAGAPVDAGALSDVRSSADAGAGSDANATFDASIGHICGDGYIDLEAGEQCDPPSGADAAPGVCTATCKMQCPGFVWSGNNHCYWAAPGSATSLNPAADNACNATSGSDHVVTFASEEEFQAVEANLRLQRTDPLLKTDPPYWVGLTTVAQRSYVSIVNYEPGWDGTCPGCYAHTLDAKGALAKYADPLTDGGLISASCVAASPDGLDPTWRERPCTLPAGLPDTAFKTRVVCEREPVGAQFTSCDAGICIDLVVTHGTKRYVLVTQPATADDAAQVCASLGGRLVVLGSRDEREQLWAQLSITSAQPLRVWIGLTQRDAGLEGDGAAPGWVWDDGIVADAPDGHPPPWGDHLPVAVGTTSRAYLRAYKGEIDDTLARNDEPAADVQTMPFVCELPVTNAP